MNEEVSCKSCDYVIPVSKDRGECHRYPPHTGGWPTVMLTSFCGGHPKLRTASAANAEAKPRAKKMITSEYRKKAAFYAAAFIAMISFLMVAYALCYAVNSTIYDKGTIEITPDGSTDWTWKGDLNEAPAQGIVVYSIQFNPSASNDVLIVHDGGIDSVPVFNSGPAGSTAPVIKYYPGGRLMRLIIDASDCTFGTAANARIYIEHEPI